MKIGGNAKTKTCTVCGRSIEWRKKWEKSWDQVKYCSDRCRSSRGELRCTGAAYESRILEILRGRARGLTMCPSEVLVGEEKHDANLMERVREAARRLVAAGSIEILQKGRVVEPSDFRGPIRLRLR